MKKLFIVILALILLLGLGATLACAKAQKIDLTNSDGDVVGWVIANKNNSGEIILQVHVQKVEKDTLFYVFIKDDVLFGVGVTGEDRRSGEFTTNKVGNGNFHVTIPSTGVTEISEVVVRKPVGELPAARYFTVILFEF